MDRHELETSIILAMPKLEKSGLAVTKIILTPVNYKILGVDCFQMAKVVEGNRNVVLSDPEFFGFAYIFPDEQIKTRHWKSNTIFYFKMFLFWAVFVLFVYLVSKHT